VRQATRAPDDDGEPGSVERARRSGRAAARDAIGLLDERDAEAGRLRRGGCGHEVRRAHAAAGAVAEHERGSRRFDAVQMDVRLP
jgi:hypothetical protein